MRKYMLALMALLSSVLLSAPAYAATVDDIVQPDPGNYIPLFATFDDLSAVLGKVWEVLVSNPLFLVLLGASLFSVGIWLFRKVKGAAKR